jgi:hypothetical protein
VQNSSGSSYGDDGIQAIYTVSYSYGSSLGTGVGIEATIAIGCVTDGGEIISSKYNMP